MGRLSGSVDTAGTADGAAPGPDTVRAAGPRGWRLTPMRLDPAALPHKFKYDTGLAGEAADAAVILERSGTMVARKLPCGVPMVMRLPIHAYRGIAAHTIPTGEPGRVLVALELVHHDPMLSIPLVVAESMEDVVADWQGWSKTLGLPMMLTEADGTVIEIDRMLGALSVSEPKPRRRRVAREKRRPRFLMRRKTGFAGEIVVVEGTEISRHAIH